ncbi:MAG: hypothetical protein RMI56_03765 [Sulfolobales archaeon]|nr:hypothetical protein [Sulfolobales archaeon]MDW8082899.1 hypothetical protein [Sulfolobales archaeon]
MLASSIPPAMIATAQVEPVAEGRARVREFLEAVSTTIAKIKEMGVDVSRAEELLTQARDALERGDLGRARSLALLALVSAGSRIREVSGAPRPIAAGILMEVAALKGVVKELGDSELELKIREAEKLLSRGLVNESVKVLKEIREAIKLKQEKTQKTVVIKARLEIEASLKARVHEEKLVEELAKTLRKAENLSTIGKALRAVKTYEKLRDRVNTSVKELDEELVNLSEKSIALLRGELGGVLEELVPLKPLGLIEAIEAKIRFVEKLRGRLSEDLKDVADKLINALLKLNETVGKMLRCEESYEDSLKEVREMLTDVLKELSNRLPSKMLPIPQRGLELATVTQLSAVAKWGYIMVSSLPKIVTCPEIGSEVIFKGVIVSVENQILAFGIMKTVKMVSLEPVYIEEANLRFPRRVAVKVGLFILDLSKLEGVSLSVGDIVSCAGRYLGYRESSRYPTIEVYQLKKLIQIEEALED